MAQESQIKRQQGVDDDAPSDEALLAAIAASRATTGGAPSTAPPPLLQPASGTDSDESEASALVADHAANPADDDAASAAAEEPGDSPAPQPPVLAGDEAGTAHAAGMPSTPLAAPEPMTGFVSAKERALLSAKAPAVSPPTPPAAPTSEGAPESGLRRTAQRRPAGPSRTRIAANDDAPSIGALLYALEQKPSRRPLFYAAVVSAVWFCLSLGFGGAMLLPELSRAPTWADLFMRPTALTIVGTILLPIALIWGVAFLIRRAQELRLMSSAMTEVAVRLAEPDRMAEQQIASLGQAVRRQVSFMDDAVTRALGRATELETLVQNEVAALDKSYADNESRIRQMLQELGGERHELLSTSKNVAETLKGLGTEIPSLIEKLGTQQLKLAKFIEDASHNLSTLDATLTARTERAEQVIVGGTHQLHAVIGGGTQRMEAMITSGSQQIKAMLEDHSGDFGRSLESHTTVLADALSERTGHVQTVFSDFTEALTDALSNRTQQIQTAFEQHTQTIDTTLSSHVDGLQTVFEEYARALDTTLANRQQSLDMQLVERTRALDDAFAERLKVFDESIGRSTMAIDGAVSDRARALTSALDQHARHISDTLGRQAAELDDSLMQGISAVRRTSENITRQSVKAIEGLAGQSELLRNVSENLLQQINVITSRFDNQGQSIMKAANSLETANFRIDSTLQKRQTELQTTLEKLSGKADQIDKVMQGYSSTLEGSINEAETRARAVGEHLTRGAEAHSRQTLVELERLKSTADAQAERALEELRSKFQRVSRQVSDELNQLTRNASQSTGELRDTATRTLSELEAEQRRIEAQIQRMPETARVSSETLRRSLNDQLRALDQLSTLTAREAARREVMAPGVAPAAAVRGVLPPAERANPAVPPSSPASTGHVEWPVTQTPQPQGSRDAWKLGDLLARASQDDGETVAPTPSPAAASVRPMSPEPRSSHDHHASGAGVSLDINSLARALDATTASAIWSRFRAGQRGIMVRSIYTHEARQVFDDVQRRYRAEPDFRIGVDRYLDDFERFLRDSEHKDPSGRATQAYIVSDTGRVYLFLGHASGRMG